MSKRVIFRIDQGDFEQGFPVTLTIKENGRLCAPEVRGRLAPAPEISDLYKTWKRNYYEWGNNNRWGSYRSDRDRPNNQAIAERQIIIPQQIDTNYSSSNSEDEVNNSAHQFETALNEWLNRSELGELTEELLQTVSQKDSANFIIQTNNKELQRIPWELWRLLRRRYDDAEVALSSRSVPESERPLSSPVRILVILGGDENIDIETDWDILQNRLPNAELVLLKKPRADELREKLRSQPWSIIFFAGHSATRASGNDGQIRLNDQEYLSPKQLRTSLERAVKDGLKLAIFNSCDGLGLARELESLQIPHIIVMREPIHDEVAQKFLDDFLTSFAGGVSLQEAVREARDQLRLIESRSPNASWLPVIFQNPEEPPLFYPREAPSTISVEEPQQNRATGEKIKKFAGWGMGAIALFTLAFVIYKIINLDKDSTRSPGISLCEEMLSQNSTPEKQAGVKACGDKNYLAAIDNFKASLQKNPNDPEARIYLNNAKAANRKEIIKIAVSVPIGNNQPIGEEILRGVAEIQEEFNRDDEIHGKPLQVVIANDDNDAQLAQEVARKFVKDSSIFAVVGHNASSASVAASPIYNAGKLVMISPSSFANELGEATYIFRMVPQMTFFAAQLSKAIVKEVNQPKVAICADYKSPDQKDFINQFKYVIAANQGQTIDIFCNHQDPNYNPTVVADAIKKNNVNTLVLSPYVNALPKASEIFKVVREKQLSIALFGSPTLYNDTTIELAGKAVEGLTLSVPYYPDPKENDSFRQLWKAELNTWRTPMAKDATKAIATGLQQLLKQSKPTRQELDKLLRDPNFKVNGVTGEFKFNSITGEREFIFQKDRTDALIRIQNGKFVKIE